ncbi:hypothetical protein GCM10023187_52220 [Nibrella viscosa]|uniref:HTH cro/C1-type domain-containing protein n=1 Tax=Nibrella viscosa TaxID=1084524 RepID=A0ABP8KXF1_9BACT
MSKKEDYDLLQLLADKGIKQGKLAESIGIKADYWLKSRKKGLSNLSLERIILMADFLNMDPEEIFEYCYRTYKKHKGKVKK